MLGLRSLLHHHSSFQINVRITNNAKKCKEYIIRKSNPSNFCQMSCMNFGNLFYSKLSTKWIIPLPRIILCSERACSLVIIRASVAPEVPGSTPYGSEYSGISRRCALSGRQRYRRQRDACGDFVNLENLPTQSLKMLIKVEFVYVCL